MKYDKDELLQTLKNYEKQLKEKDKKIKVLNQKLTELRIATCYGRPDQGTRNVYPCRKIKVVYLYVWQALCQRGLEEK